AEHLARAEDRQEVLAAVVGAAAQLDLAARDDVEAVARLALAEQHVAPGELDLLHRLEEGARLVRVHGREQGGGEHNVVVHAGCPIVSSSKNGPGQVCPTAATRVSGAAATVGP